jgi:hypothetical protein
MSTNLFTQLAQGQNTTVDQITIELVRTDDGMSVSMVIQCRTRLSYEVEQGARAIAAAVRGGSMSRSELFRGLQPSAADKCVDYAVSQQWVVLAGDRVALGPVGSRPAAITSIPNWRAVADGRSVRVFMSGPSR